MTGAEPQPEHGDERRAGSERLGAIARRFLSRGPTAEERLTQFVEEWQREFDEQAARFEQTLADLEQRELVLSDARASIERLLRLSSKDLDARDADITRLMDELEDRYARLREQEAELALRRGELGAVELKRLVVEQRERALAVREATIEAAEERLAEEEAPSPPAEQRDEEPAATLAFVPSATYRLIEIDPAVVEAGTLVVEGQEYLVLRTGPSPLPGDKRRCVYLVRGPGDAASSAGSS